METADGATVATHGMVTANGGKAVEANTIGGRATGAMKRGHMSSDKEKQELNTDWPTTRRP